jgi:hypothetical protein
MVIKLDYFLYFARVLTLSLRTRNVLNLEFTQTLPYILLILASATGYHLSLTYLYSWVTNLQHHAGNELLHIVKFLGSCRKNSSSPHRIFSYTAGTNHQLAGWNYRSSGQLRPLLIVTSQKNHRLLAGNSRSFLAEIFLRSSLQFLD